jgi:hypothetical protein
MCTVTVAPRTFAAKSEEFAVRDRYALRVSYCAKLT